MVCNRKNPQGGRMGWASEIPIGFKKVNNTQLITLFLTRSKLSVKSSVADISVNEYLKNRNWLMTFFGP